MIIRSRNIGRTVTLIEYCIKLDKTMLYACMEPEKAIIWLQSKFPNVKMNVVKYGVEINVK